MLKTKRKKGLKKRQEKRKETTKRDGKRRRAETATSDSGKQQRQHDSRWLARHCSLLALYFFLHVLSFSTSFLSARARGSALRSLLCLSSTLRSFVLFLGPLEGLIAAHTRSPFVSSFYHLFPTILPSCLNPSSILFLSSRPMHPNRLQSTTTANRAKRRVTSHSPLLLARSTTLGRTRVPMLFISSSLVASDFLFEATRRTCHSVPFPFSS